MVHVTIPKKNENPSMVPRIVEHRHRAKSRCEGLARKLRKAYPISSSDEAQVLRQVKRIIPETILFFDKVSDAAIRVAEGCLVVISEVLERNKKETSGRFSFSRGKTMLICTNLGGAREFQKLRSVSPIFLQCVDSRLSTVGMSSRRIPC